MTVLIWPLGNIAIKLTHKKAPHLGGSGGPRWCSECRRVEVRTQGFQKYKTLGVCFGRLQRYGFGGLWGALGGLDNKVMVLVVIYLSCPTNFIFELF